MPDRIVHLPIGVTIARSGTQIAAAVGDPALAGALVARFPAPPSPDEAVAAVEALVRRAAEQAEDAAGARVVPSAVGIAVEGRVDAPLGTVRALPQAPDWAGFPLAGQLRTALNVPVRIGSLVDAEALAEATHGAGATADTGTGEPASPLLYVALGRFVEAGIVTEGRVFAGAQGMAGMLGHVRVAEDGPRCSCGATGHLGAIASSQAVVRTMIGRAADHEESLAAMLRVTGGRAEAITAPQVVSLAVAGDLVAAAVVGEATAALAQGLAAAVALLDPALIVLAGPLAEAGDAFLTPLADRLQALCQHRPDVPPLLPARLGPRAALTGALLLAGQAAENPAS